MNQDSPIFGHAIRVKRSISIEEKNAIATMFNTKVVYSTDSLPEWFRPLQHVFEDIDFTKMTIQIKDVLYIIKPIEAESQASHEHS